MRLCDMCSISSLLFLLATSFALACTGITVKTQNGAVISSRTLEFGMDLESDVIFIPRNYQMQALLPDGGKGMAWKQKYATLGTNGLGYAIIVEGFNEKGLSAGAFYLPGYAEFSKLTPANAPKAMLSIDFVGWILGNFATVDEVKSNISSVVVVDGEVPGVGMAFPMHYRVTDTSGKVIVIEFVDGGRMKIYDNPLGVITNSPTWDWHMTNLSNYVNLSATNVAKKDIDGVAFASFGQGSGMMGLPGDFTPPSRLVRILAIQQSALPVRTADEGVTLAWNIIDNVNIPKGAARDVSPDGQTHYDYTQWVNVSDLRNLRFYFRNYDNPQIRVVSMKELNLDGGNIMAMGLKTKPEYLNVSFTAKKAALK